jgi:hypothetical protein
MCPATNPAPPQATQAAKLAPPVKGAAQAPQITPIVFQFIPNGIIFISYLVFIFFLIVFSCLFSSSNCSW